jgi:hypothetical protein
MMKIKVALKGTDTWKGRIRKRVQRDKEIERKNEKGHREVPDLKGSKIVGSASLVIVCVCTCMCIQFSLFYCSESSGGIGQIRPFHPWGKVCIN